MSYAKEWDEEHKRRLMFAEPLRAVREFFEDFDDPTEFSVLEVGCGAGSNALWLAKQGFEVYAFDSSPHAIRRLKEIDNVEPGIAAWIGDATKRIPAIDEFFDVVFEVRALENLDTTEALMAMQEMVRVLKPGGLFYSLTASSGRDLSTTTCGKVRKTSEKQATAYLESLGLEHIEYRHVFENVHDLEIVATKEARFG